MSPNVGNFVHDLVEMAKAMETLPLVQAENERLTRSINDALTTVQERELAIIDYKSLIDSLNSRIRSLEVERDDASFRVLEAEDKAHHVLNWARDTQALMGQVISELDSSKPEHELQPQAVSTTTDQSVVDPTVNTGQAEPVAYSEAAISTDAGTTITETSSAEEAPKSDANPTVAPAYSPTTENVLTQATSTDVSNSESATSDLHKGPYFGKRYYDMPTYISVLDWFEGGGAEADYYWRPVRDNVL